MSVCSVRTILFGLTNLCIFLCYYARFGFWKSSLTPTTFVRIAIVGYRISGEYVLPEILIFIYYYFFCFKF